LITCDGYYRAGKVLNLKKDADEALMNVRTVEDVLVVNRMGKNLKIPLINGRDEWYHDLIDGQSAKCKTEVMDAEDLLFLLYTSGTTGKPKGVMHTHAGYALGTHVTTKWVFDMKGEDIYWCIADIGWITGHSYVVYGPLSVGATSVIYVGAPVYPHPNRPFEIVEKYGVTVYYSTPTAIRLFMHYGEEWPRRHDLSSLRLLGAVGEPLNPEAWMWFYKHIGQEKCPIMDTWWQTETGMHLITPLPILPLKPGSTTLPFPGIEADVLNEKGESLSYKEGGHLVIKTPWPAMLRGLYKEPERYMKGYWSKFEGIYLTGDGARRDKDGYFWVQGREDDILKIAGHRIGNSEIESALVSHEAVAEAAVVERPDEIRGGLIEAFVILKEDVRSNANLKGELIQHVAKELSPIAKPAAINFVSDLPKTRSGKIMRRVVGALVKGKSPGDITTLSNPECVEEIKHLIEGR
jgi:acetyl-CoA synthetase